MGVGIEAEADDEADVEAEDEDDGDEDKATGCDKGGGEAIEAGDVAAIAATDEDDTAPGVVAPAFGDIEDGTIGVGVDCAAPMVCVGDIEGSRRTI